MSRKYTRLTQCSKTSEAILTTDTASTREYVLLLTNTKVAWMHFLVVMRNLDLPVVTSHELIKHRLKDLPTNTLSMPKLCDSNQTSVSAWSGYSPGQEKGMFTFTLDDSTRRNLIIWLLRLSLHKWIENHRQLQRNGMGDSDIKQILC